ncbi:hypothetical protein LCGC14_0338150 [marine sediment metagenome]|uniref:Uncharacterized protein n=1 Tax=marine sediment metagenome TaxID=412755 RepID=A0A0F9W1Q9_9ZZZZ
MTASTCRDCAARVQIDAIVSQLQRAIMHMNVYGHLDLDMAYRLIAEAEPLLATVIDIKREL